MNVLLYHGKRKEHVTSAAAMAAYSVAITSYTMLANECGSIATRKGDGELIDLASDDEAPGARCHRLFGICDLDIISAKIIQLSRLHRHALYVGPERLRDALTACGRVACAGAGTGKGKKKRAYGDDGLLFRVHWRRVVLDEAQFIKNHRTKVAQAAWQLSATHRRACSHPTLGR